MHPDADSEGARTVTIVPLADAVAELNGVGVRFKKNTAPA